VIVDLTDRSGGGEAIGEETDGLAQSSEDGETQAQQRKTEGFRPREENGTLMVSSLQGGRCEGLGRVHSSGDGRAESKGCSGSAGQVCGTMDPAQGKRHGAKAHKRTESEGSQHPTGTAQQPSRLNQDGRHGRHCAEWSMMLLSSVVKMGNPN
jgi:hypothetical protein